MSAQERRLGREDPIDSSEPSDAPDRRYNTAECLLWWGEVTEHGYGVGLRRGRRIPAHRLIYEECFGSIPGRAHIHHLCRNRSCVNPEHLTALAPSSHMRLHGRPGKTIRTLASVRFDSGLSLTGLAALTGLHKPVLSQIERGRIVASQTEADLIAKALGLRPGQLVTRTMLVLEESR